MRTLAEPVQWRCPDIVYRNDRVRIAKVDQDRVKAITVQIQALGANGVWRGQADRNITGVGFDFNDAGGARHFERPVTFRRKVPPDTPCTIATLFGSAAICIEDPIRRQQALALIALLNEHDLITTNAATAVGKPATQLTIDPDVLMAAVNHNKIVAQTMPL
ncbi:MAG: hypothetical protein DHS20C11_23160 [Lysobacteraceae bacterium]|nr:MAG: hypothetical protein DHS20C11_23160 [Xanthomonadaceae bacterium]